jgi:hypothetical protein
VTGDLSVALLAPFVINQDPVDRPPLVVRTRAEGRMTQVVFAWSSMGRVPSADPTLGTVVATTVDVVQAYLNA